jgi:nucleotide-binding universal stress UspA family protein
MYNKIMVPLDGSELAECVLPHLKNFMEGFPASKVVLVRVVEPIPISMQGETYSRKDINLEEREAERKADARNYLDTIMQGLKNGGSNMESEVLIGRVADSLADFAEKNGVDIVLIATHGRSGVSRWVRGSVADKILRSSRVPVLMVRAPGTKGGI